MRADDVALALVLIAVLLFLLHCPLLKPWFGFKRPPGHPGRWFE